MDHFVEYTAQQNRTGTGTDPSGQRGSLPDQREKKEQIKKRQQKTTARPIVMILLLLSSISVSNDQSRSGFTLVK